MMYTGYGQEVLHGMGVAGAGNGLVGTTDLEHVRLFPFLHLVSERL